MKGQSPSRLCWLATGLAVLFGILMILATSPGSFQGGLSTDTDSLMRMAFLEWSVQHGHIADYLFPRDNVPHGLVLPWTLPYDLMAIALAAPFALFEGWHLGLQHAGLIAGSVGYILDCAAAIALARAAGLGKAAPWILFWLALAPSIVGDGAIGRLGDTGVTAALGTMALASALTLVRRGTPRAGIESGLWMVLAAWENIGSDPALLVAWSVVVIGAALRRTKDKGFLAYAGTLPAAAAIALAIDPDPSGYFAPIIDRFGLFQVVILSAMALIISLTVRFRGKGGPVSRLLKAAGVGVVPIGLLLLLGHRLEASGNSLFASIYLKAFAPGLRPAWRSTGLFLAACCPGGLLILITLSGVGRRLARPQAMVWILASIILGGEVALGIRFAELAPYAAITGAVLVGAVTRRWAGFATRHAGGRRVRTVLAAGCLLGIGLTGVMAACGVAKMARPQTLAGSCVIGSTVAASIEAALPAGSLVAADLWYSPELLERTSMRTVAGPFQRNLVGIYDLAFVFAGAPPNIIGRMELGKRHADALLACTSPSRSTIDIFDDRSLERRLAAGNVPSWLVKVPGVGEGRFGLYLVRDKQMTDALNAVHAPGSGNGLVGKGYGIDPGLKEKK